MPNKTKYYKQTTKKSGEVKQKQISQKKYEKKAARANKDVWDENPDNKVILRPQASYSPKGKTTSTKVIERGDQPKKKTFIKETFEPGKEEPNHPKGGYIQMPSPMRKDLERSALMMGKIKNPAKSKTTYFESSNDTFRRGNKTKGYLAPGTEDDPRYESGKRAFQNPQSPGYEKKNKNVEVHIGKYGSTRQKGGKVKNISERRANRIIDRYERRVQRKQR